MLLKSQLQNDSKLSILLYSLASIFISTHSIQSFADSDIDKKVLQIFQDNCADCHSPGGKKNKRPELHKDIDLKALRSDSTYVNTTNFADSLIHQRITLPDDDSDRMPETKGKKGDPNFRERLKEADIEIIKKWIQGASDTPTTNQNSVVREFVSQNDEIQAAFNDLRSLPAQERKYKRYLSIANLFNEKNENGKSSLSDEDLRIAKMGVDKLLNSLSKEKSIRLSQAVDKNKVILKFDLRDYGWKAEDWKNIESFYPYMLEKDSFEENQLELMSATKLPILRADWFVTAASQAPLYHELLKLPDNSGSLSADATLEKELGVNVNENLKNGNALRQGFRDSGVSTGKRLLERHTLEGGGYYWKSYDFNEKFDAEAGHNIFLAPLGPTNANLSSKFAFKQDGGELIFSLPNGLQAYLLINSQGKRIDLGPSEIVQDNTHPQKLIVNGMSCISCHDRGMKNPKVGFKDEVKTASSVLDLIYSEVELVNKLYKGSEANKQAIEDDSNQFSLALEKLGIPKDIREEPVRYVYNLFMRPIKKNTLSSEFGTVQYDLLNDLSHSDNGELRVFAQSLKNDIPLERKLFAKRFQEIGANLILGTTKAATRFPIEFEVNPNASNANNAQKPENTKHGPRPSEIITVPSSQFSRIQDALDYAQDGDEIFIKNGTYNESLVITKKITFRGETRDGVIIKSTDGASAGILIVDNEVKLENFTLLGDFDPNNPDASKNKSSKSTWGMVNEYKPEGGVFVSSVENGGPFDKAGIVSGMEILSVDSHKIGMGAELQFLRDSKNIGSLFKVTARLGSILKNFDVITQAAPKLITFTTGLALIRAQGKFTNITIKNFPGSGINSYGPQRKLSPNAELQNWRGYNLSVSDCGFNGMTVTDAPTIENSTFKNNRNFGVLINVSSYRLTENSDTTFFKDIELKKVDASSNQLDGFHFNNKATGTLNNCTAKFNKNSGIQVSGTFAETQQSSEVTGVYVYGGDYSSNYEFGVKVKNRGKLLIKSGTLLDGNVKGKADKSENSTLLIY